MSPSPSLAVLSSSQESSIIIHGEVQEIDQTDVCQSSMLDQVACAHVHLTHPILV